MNKEIKMIKKKKKEQKDSVPIFYRVGCRSPQGAAGARAAPALLSLGGGLCRTPASGWEEAPRV